jgi:hypothetical protein
MRALVIWAFIAGLLNGILLRLQDFLREVDELDASEPVFRPQR